MFKLDNNFLIELGLGDLPPVEKNKMLAHIYETLEMRVGMKLAEQMSNEQLDEFESYINAQDEAGALKWLETNFPNYKQVVAEELEKLKGEIMQVAPQIVQQAQQVAASQPQTFTEPSASGQTGQPVATNNVQPQVPRVSTQGPIEQPTSGFQANQNMPQTQQQPIPNQNLNQSQQSQSTQPLNQHQPIPNDPMSQQQNLKIDPQPQAPLQQSQNPLNRDQSQQPPASQIQ